MKRRFQKKGDLLMTQQKLQNGLDLQSRDVVESLLTHRARI